MKKKIYFFQPNSMLGNSVYLPYAAGCLLAYSFTSETVKNNFEIGGIIFKEDSEEDVLKSVINPDVVCFSCYFWNYQYNLEMAGLLKNKYPDCIVIFGGHQVSDSDETMKKYSFIDYVICGEGEIPMLQLFESVSDNSDVSSVPNIYYRDGDKVIRTESKPVCAEYYPSPYGEGIFENLLNYGPEIELNAMLETSRGCPYHCAYCDWCDYDLPVRQFPIERIKSDIEWISSHKISYCMCIDSNFGIFEKDETVTDILIESSENTGYPKKFGASFAKNKTDRTFRINKKLNDSGLSKGASLAFQSMSEEVLSNIGRSNMKKEELVRQLKMYREASIPTYTELILGLPGETAESFRNGIYELLDLGQHDTINVFLCEIYPNSLIATDDYIEKFKIKSGYVRANLNHSNFDDSEYIGGLRCVYETSTMSHEDIVDCVLFSAFIAAFHCRGISQYSARFLNSYEGISYKTVYDSLFSLSDNTFIGKELKKIRDSISRNLEGELDFSFISKEAAFITWPYDEALFCNLISDKEKLYEDIESVLMPMLKDEKIFSDLMKFQKSAVCSPGFKGSVEKFNYDWVKYFSSDELELTEETNEIEFSPAVNTSGFEDYLRKIVWYGRRNKSTINNIKKL